MIRPLHLPAAVALCLALQCLGCTEDSAPSAGAAPGSETLVVHAVDVWGRPMPLSLLVVDAGAAQPAGESYAVPLRAAGESVHLRLEGEADYLPLEAQVEGGASPSATLSPGSGNAAIAFAREPARPGRLHLFLGQDHAWFAASGRPLRTNCSLELFLSGEGYWSAVHEALRQRPHEVLLGTWWWQSDFELVRPPGHPAMDEAERRPNTMLALLEASVPSSVRVLVAWFLGNTAEGLAYLNTDPALRAKARGAGDGFEVMVQANPSETPLQDPFPEPPLHVPFVERLAARPELAHLTFDAPAVASFALDSVDAASYHQKFLVVDRSLGFVSGMNIKSTDWDTPAHRVFEPRRMKFSSSVEERRAVQERRALPDLVPRKDYGVRLRGPAVADLVDLYADRWAEGRRAGALFAEHTSAFEPEIVPPSAAGGLTVQVQATLPAPLWENSILESHRKALGHARDYVYIEDQYFRAPLINSILLQRMAEEPGLHLVVITQAVSAADGGKKYTYEADRAFREAFPERYLLLQLKSFELKAERGRPVPGELPPAGAWIVPQNIHSKIMLVDDRYLSVGSANKNNRGYLYEAELNVSVLDEDFVTAARRQIVSNLLGAEQDPRAARPFAEVFAELRAVAAQNAAVEAFWLAQQGAVDADFVLENAELTPEGFVYPLEIDGDYLLDVGPDAF